MLKLAKPTGVGLAPCPLYDIHIFKLKHACQILIELIFVFEDHRLDF